jgi:short-subunit dehydrogenase
MNFTNKVIWITGASSGIGKAMALEFSKLKTKLILSSRNLQELENVKNECNSSSEVAILQLDLEDYSHFPKKVTEAIALFGHVDILVNNGGISQRSKAIDTAILVDKKIMDVNYFGTIALSKALLPYFISQKSGQFVVITSVVGKVATPVRSSYSASKHALHGFFDSLRAEIFEHNLFVTLICPGYVKTNISMNALTGTGAPQNKMDTATNNGLTPSNFSKKALKAIYAKKNEVYIAGSREKSAIYLKRFFPKLLAKLIRKMAVT